MADGELPVDLGTQAKGVMAQSQTNVPMAYAYPDMGAYFGEAPAADARLDWREIFRVLLKRKWLIGVIVVICLVLAALWVLLQKPLYTSAVRLQIDRNVVNILKGNNAPSDVDYSEDYLATEIELLKGRNLAERVASRLQLGGKADVSAAASSKRAERERVAANSLLGAVTVRAVMGTRLVDIISTDADPRRAQAIADAYGEAYVASNLDKRFQANASAKMFLEDQLKQLKLRLEESEKALLAFAEKEQIVATADKASVAENNLAAANAALGAIIAERIKNEQQWRQAQSASGIDLPQLLTNKAIEELRARRGQLAAEYQEKSQTFRANYPEMLQLSNKIKEIDHQINVEVKAVKSSLKAAFEASASQESEMKQRIEKLRLEALDLQKRSIQYNILKREVDTTRSLYESLLQRYKEVDVASGVGANNVFIVERAQLPGAPTSPNRPKTLMIALALGLAMGVGAAFALEHFDDIIDSPLEGEQVSGLILHGVIPKPTSNKSFEEEMQDPRSAISEALRSTCTSLQFSTESGAPKTLVITSATPGEGKSSVALGIAHRFAALGVKVLVIDADLRKPAIHAKIGIDNSVGLSSYLTRNCEATDAIRHVAQSNIHLIAAGPTPPDPVELLNGARFASLLSSSSEVFDMIIIDGPPVMGMADALVLGNLAKATLFVVAIGQARAGLIRNALKRMRQARVIPLGLVVTKFDTKTDRYHYGYHGSYSYAPEKIAADSQRLEHAAEEGTSNDGSAG